MAQPSAPELNFWVDGVMPTPAEHAATLVELTRASDDLKDRYGRGGAVEALEEAFATLLGTERAIYLPSGTMANQLAIRVLANDAPTVLVQENSHVSRDEGDAAQTVHGKRLVLLAPRRPSFTADEMRSTLRRVRDAEGTETRIGALSIESPVARAEGAIFPIDELRKVCALARENDMGLHLDGARLFLASEYSGVSLHDYAALFDTVYVSLYKYLRAPSGAILCGSEVVIARVRELRKTHGGDMYQNWPYAAAALRFLPGFRDRFAEARTRADALFGALTRSGRFTVDKTPNGSNIFRLRVEGDAERFRNRLREKAAVKINRPDEDGSIRLHVNETQLAVPASRLREAFLGAADV